MNIYHIMFYCTKWRWKHALLHQEHEIRADT